MLVDDYYASFSLPATSEPDLGPSFDLEQYRVDAQKSWEFLNYLGAHRGSSSFLDSDAWQKMILTGSGGSSALVGSATLGDYRPRAGSSGIPGSPRARAYMARRAHRRGGAA